MGIMTFSIMMDKMFAIPPRKRPPELREYYKNLMKWGQQRKKDLPIYVAVNFLKAINEWSVVDRLHEIKVPTLIIFGDQDTMTDREKYSKLLNENIPNSELVLIKGAGHNPETEQTDEYNRVLQSFLEKFE